MLQEKITSNQITKAEIAVGIVEMDYYSYPQFGRQMLVTTLRKFPGGNWTL